MRYALCIGLNYTGTKKELKGCISDARNVQKYLVSHGFEVDILTDEKAPVTGDKVVQCIRALITKVNKCNSLCKVVIHYSGHGSHVKDVSGDESDGSDEVICTSNSYISDDTLHSLIAKFRRGTRLFCLFDCCHSGTVLDLRYNSNVLENRKCFIQNDVVSISGCSDSQVSTDIQYKNGESHGAMTHSFLQCVTDTITITSLVNNMRKSTKKYKQTPAYTHTSPRNFELSHFIG